MRCIHCRIQEKEYLKKYLYEEPQNAKERKVFKKYVEALAREKGRESDLQLYENVEVIAPKLIAENRNTIKRVSPNVDFYSGFVYDMLGIPRELYTAIFAVARVVGWSAHRMEELICTDKIIRPAYMSVMEEKEKC